MPLNQGQQAAFVDVIKFINDPDQQFMDVSGGAGTGKTYFISQVADSILQHKKKHCKLEKVVITATTNKAAAVIAEAMPNRAGTIKTIYSHMALRVSEDYSTGKTKIVPTPNWFVHDCEFIIIDECSMIDKNLFSYLIKGISNTCKVLFVGDKNQLAPVGEKLSPIYTQGYNTSYLSVPVRNAEQPALMALCEQAKQTVLTGVFTPILEVPGVIDLVSGTYVQGVLEREFGEEDPSRRVISYTNRRVIQYNSFIRDIRDYKEPFEVGEILSNNTSAELAGKERLYTDQIVRVKAITDDYMDKTIIDGEEIRMIIMNVEDVNTLQIYQTISFADTEDRRLAMQYYSQRKKWDRYFKIKAQYPDLRSVSASTTHKAQGSTYKSVVVDLADIGKSTNKEQTARLQYVALSRPKSRIYVRGQLPERYFP